jgi:hypothetical protein
VIAAVITLGWELTRNRSAWLEATPSARRDRLIKTLRSVGLAFISGASLSLAVSVAIALIPGAQIWLMAGAICSAARALPGPRDQAFDLKTWIRA